MGQEHIRNTTVNSQAANVNNVHINHVNIKNLSCIYTNADQLNNKFNELQLLVHAQKPDVIAIIEIKPKNSRYLPIIGEYILDDYNMWSTNIEEKMEEVVSYTQVNI